MNILVVKVAELLYNNLVNSIYTNTDIARIVVDGASNGGFSFLLMSLWNHNLKLTEEQKAFAVNEAMNKIGTTRWQQSKEAFSKKLDDMGISDDNTTFINIDGCINPIGQKSGSQYMNYIFSTLSSTQAHGVGEFDIRYHILRNPNWSLDEKQKLIMDFWCDDETYDEYLEQWEWGIINDSANFKDNPASLFEKLDLYEYTYEMLLKFYGDKETTDRIWNEIQFCKQMHQLRPQQWELEFTPKKKVLVQHLFYAKVWSERVKNAQNILIFKYFSVNLQVSKNKSWYEKNTFYIVGYHLSWMFFRKG